MHPIVVCAQQHLGTNTFHSIFANRLARTTSPTQQCMAPPMVLNLTKRSNKGSTSRVTVQDQKRWLCKPKSGQQTTCHRYGHHEPKNTSITHFRLANDSGKSHPNFVTASTSRFIRFWVVPNAWFLVAPELASFGHNYSLVVGVALSCAGGESWRRT